MLCWWVSWTPPPSGCPHSPPLHTTMLPCIALVMPFSRDTLTELNMTLVRLSGAKSLRDPLVFQLLGVEWVASSPLARARWSEATEVGYPSLIRDKQNEAVKQYASHLFPAPDLIGLLIDLNVPKLGFRHVSEYMSRRGRHGRNGPPVPPPHPHSGYVHGHVEGVGHPLTYGHPCPSPIPRQVGALRRYPHGPGTSNHVQR